MARAIPDPEGLKTDYLWKPHAHATRLTDILENYTQIVEEKDAKTGQKKRLQIWPRYHQLEVVRRLLASAGVDGVGPVPDSTLRRQWQVELHRLAGASVIGMKQDDTVVFDSIIVVTDRRILDKQIATRSSSSPRSAPPSAMARTRVTCGHSLPRQKIIISTVQKFPFILDEIGNEHRGRRSRSSSTRPTPVRGDARRRKCLRSWGQAAVQGGGVA